MKKIVLPVPALVLFLALSIPAFAGFSNAPAPGGGGFSGPGPAISTVVQVLDMRDDAPAAMRGNIVSHQGGDKYLFRDSTGDIVLEIDQKYWGGLHVTPNDTVVVHGKLDKDFTKKEFDVKGIQKQ